MLDDVHYEFIAMPFGLSTAPKIFTDLVVEFKKIAMTWGFHLNQYLDDWINRDLDQVIAQHRIWQLMQLVVFLGFVPNYEKSCFVPSTHFDFLGGSYDLVAQTLKPTARRVAKLMAATSSSLQDSQGIHVAYGLVNCHNESSTENRPNEYSPHSVASG